MPLNISGRNLYFKSGIDNKQLKKDAKKGSKEIDNMTKKVKKSGDSMAAGLKKAFKFIIGAVIVKKILDIGKALFKAGSDAEEIRSKFAVTFQSINDEADATAKSLSKNFGLARTTAEELLSTTGDLLTGFGFTRKEALDTSTAVQQLAVDLSSFNNLAGGTAQASHIITKALLGERETLTTLGVKIMDTDLQQELLNRGMEKLTGTALLQAKALITLDMIAKQSKNAIGDFARTSQSAANQAKLLKENIKDLTVNFGKRLSPVVGESLINMNKLVESFVELTNVKVSDQLGEERSEINLLLGSITSLNEGNDVRKGLIDELAGKYPELLKNLDLEKVANEDLLGILRDYNTEIDKKIKRTVWEEELLEIEDRKKIAYLEEKQFIKDVERWYSTFVKTKKEGISVEEKLQALKKEELDLSKKWESAQTRILMSSITEETIRNDAIKAEENLNEIRQKRFDLIEEYFDLLKKEPPAPKPRKVEEPEVPDVPVPELTRIEAIKELNGLLGKQSELQDEISKQQLKNDAKLKPFLASIKGLYTDLGVASFKEGKSRLKMIDSIIEAETKAGRSIEKLLNERGEIIEEMNNDLYLIEDVMYGISGFIGVMNADIGQLIAGATTLISSLTTGNVAGIFGGIVSIFRSIIELMEGQPIEDRVTAQDRVTEAYEKFKVSIDAVNTNLRTQIKLLTEINGTEWLSGAVESIEDIREEMEKLADQTDLGFGFMNPLESAESKIERLRKMLYEFRTTGEHAGLFASKEVEERISDLIDAYDAQQELLEDMLNAYHEELTGTTVESIASSITDGFAEGLDSAEVFANTFEDLMRNSLTEALKRSLYDKGLEQFYANFYRAVESGGGLDEAEIERLREEYNQILANAEEAWAGMSELLGDEFALPGEEDPLVGAIKGVTEETAGVLAGQMMAIRINVAEGLEVAENSFLQLVEIAENTSYNHYLEQITGILQQNSEQALLRSGG